MLVKNLQIINKCTIRMNNIDISFKFSGDINEIPFK